MKIQKDMIIVTVGICLLLGFYPQVAIGKKAADRISPKDFSEKDVFALVDGFEKAYMDKDLETLATYVDEKATFTADSFSTFLERLTSEFQVFDTIRFYHQGIRAVEYEKGQIIVIQHTIRVSYGRTQCNYSDYFNGYFIKKIGGQYKIVSYNFLPHEDYEFVKKAEEAWLSNDLVKAASYYSRAIEKNKENSVAYARLGCVYAAMLKPDEAIQNLKTAVELAPEVGFSRFLLSLVYDLFGKSEEAAAQMQKAIEADPGISSLSKMKLTAEQVQGTDSIETKPTWIE